MTNQNGNKQQKHGQSPAPSQPSHEPAKVAQPGDPMQKPGQPAQEPDKNPKSNRSN